MIIRTILLFFLSALAFSSYGKSHLKSGNPELVSKIKSDEQIQKMVSFGGRH